MYEIIAIRTVMAADESHEHVELVGYHSPHITEPIMVPIARILQRLALGDKFYVDVAGEKAELKPGSCPACGEEPYLRTTADSGDGQALLTLPRK